MKGCCTRYVNVKIILVRIGIGRYGRYPAFVAAEMFADDYN